jgi:hypothetical protein
MSDPMPVVSRKHYWQPFLVLVGFTVAVLACVWLSWLRSFVALAALLMLTEST